jgi:thymidylate synthase (FAD)
MKVLDKGEVRLINKMGGDLAVIAAARVSNGVEYEAASKGEEADQKLLNYLIKHRHGTPFEHSTFQFYVKAPLFVVLEWQRHRMASYNEISGRYVEFEPEFYIPNKWRIPASTNKQGSVFPDIEFLNRWKGEHPYANDYRDGQVFPGTFHGKMTNTLELYCKEVYGIYLYYIEQGVAKEMARMVLPLNLYTQFYFTVNARSLMNFVSLRAAEDAQWEIRQYALTIKEIFKEVMPLTYNGWEKNGFLAP